MGAMGLVWPASVKARIQPGDRVVLIGDADDNGFRCRMCRVNVPAPGCVVLMHGIQEAHVTKRWFHVVIVSPQDWLAWH